DIVKILESNGFSIQRQGMTKTRFYFSRILEATRS
ncbi:MAG: magnesium protoporphyrin IX methyltransferase, partial [Cyanobacteriota bacterium]